MPVVKDRQCSWNHSRWGIPKSFIDRFGASDGYVLSVLCFRQSKAKLYPAGDRPWFTSPLARRAKGKKGENKSYRPLTDAVPWIKTAAGMYGAIKRLNLAGVVEVEKWGTEWIKTAPRGGKQIYVPDNTSWYRLPERVMKEWTRALKNSDELRYFNPDEAAELKINCALVLNVIYKTFSVKEADSINGRVVLSQNAIAKDTGLAVSSVGDCFKKLKASHLSTYDGITYRLLVPNPCMMKGNGKGRRDVGYRVNVTIAETSANPMDERKIMEAAAVVETEDLERIPLVLLYLMVLAEKETTRKNARYVRKRLRGERGELARITGTAGAALEKLLGKRRRKKARIAKEEREEMSWDEKCIFKYGDGVLQLSPNQVKAIQSNKRKRAMRDGMKGIALAS